MRYVFTAIKTSPATAERSVNKGDVTKILLGAILVSVKITMSDSPVELMGVL